jgi:heterodisulfide reductase subunit B
MNVDAMALCCPSCYLQFDNNQFLMEKEGEKFGIPILYFTELMGLAMGYKPEELGLDSHRIDANGFMEKWERLNRELTKTEEITRAMEAGFGIAQP